MYKANHSEYKSFAKTIKYKDYIWRKIKIDKSLRFANKFIYLFNND